MKRVLLILVAVLFTTGAFAQEWSAGVRVGSGIQALGQYKYDTDKYLEARFGALWNNPVYGVWRGDSYHQSRIMLDFTALHNWNVLEMDWTPRGGMWFFDAGAGVSVGGRKNYAYVGLTAMARLGFTFNNLPLTLAVDWSPTFGPAIWYGTYIMGGDDFGGEWGVANTPSITRATAISQRSVGFNDLGLANFGISCTYNF